MLPPMHFRENSVTVKDYADIWIHEGIATYCEMLYVDHKYGHDKFNRMLMMYSAEIQNKYPVVGPYNVAYWNYKDGDKYVKGALMLQKRNKECGYHNLTYLFGLYSCVIS
jgi:hypothetical protein